MAVQTTLFPKVDKLIHEPSRLAILTVLASCHSADLMLLLQSTGLKKPTLMLQLERLSEAGLIRLKKVMENDKPRTLAVLSKKGERTLMQYWNLLDKIRRQKFQAEKLGNPS
jgi:DNA-binding MarR family transcriptional regulator